MSTSRVLQVLVLVSAAMSSSGCCILFGKCLQITTLDGVTECLTAGNDAELKVGLLKAKFRGQEATKLSALKNAHSAAQGAAAAYLKTQSLLSSSGAITITKDSWTSSTAATRFATFKTEADKLLNEPPPPPQPQPAFVEPEIQVKSPAIALLAAEAAAIVITKLLELDGQWRKAALDAFQKELDLAKPASWDEITPEYLNAKYAKPK
jgi:hypothetical protein